MIFLLNNSFYWITQADVFFYKKEHVEIGFKQKKRK